MMPVIDKLISEGVKIEKFETWHHEKNAQKLQEADKGRCGGVPFFHNTQTNQYICGATDEQRVRAWARGELDRSETPPGVGMT
jgi:hypothetical protein